MVEDRFYDMKSMLLSLIRTPKPKPRKDICHKKPLVKYFKDMIKCFLSDFIEKTKVDTKTDL